MPRLSHQLVRITLGALALSICAAGCNLAGTAPQPIAGQREADAVKKPSDAVILSESPSSGEVAATLAGEDWVETLPPRDAWLAMGPAVDRWRHAGLEAILAQRDARASLRTALKSAEKVVAANAAIGLAHFDDAKLLPRLVEAARTPGFKISTRGAAIEAIGKLSAPAADQALAELVATLGQPTGPAKARYSPELHADLVRTIGRRPPGDNDEALKQALASPAAAVRLEAVRAFFTERRICPPQAADLVADDASSVRAAAVRLLAEHRHEQAQECAVRALADYDLAVRLAAIEALGRLPAEENGRRLTRLMQHSADVVRASAAVALARRGDFVAVRSAASDKSWRVRCAVAECLVGMPAAERGEIALALVRDSSVDVQRRMVDALADWPLDEAVPLLLACLEGRTAATRRAAAAQLRTRWPAATDLPAQVSQERFAEEAGRLRAIWKEERD